MRTALLATLALVSGFASAQTTKYITSPPGFLSTEAGEYSPALGTNYRMARYFGAYANGEIQIIDDHLRGGGLKLLKQLDYRSDTRWHSAANSVGRSFANVRLSLGNGDLNAPVSRTFSLNNTATPTLVFSGSMNWPTVTQNQNASGPNNWGVISFPLSSNYVVTGTGSLVKHFAFQGGQLSNGGAWSGGTTASYLLDAHFNEAANAGYYYISTTTDVCVDSFYPQAQFAYAYLYPTTYATNIGLVGFERANTIFFDTSINRVAGMQPVISAISVAAANIPLGFTRCRSTTSGNPVTPNLLVDLTQSLLISGVANFNGTFTNNFKVPFHASLVGVGVYNQGAWADSKTGQLATTRRAWGTIAAQPPGKMLALYNTSLTGTATAVSPWMDRIPLVRYSYQ